MVIDTLLSVWDSFSFLGALYIAALLVAHKLEYRVMNRAKFTGAMVFMLIVPLLSSAFYYRIPVMISFSSSYLLQAAFGAGSCIIIFLSSLIVIEIFHRCNLLEALFCTSAAYCMQHFTQRLSSLIITIFRVDSIRSLKDLVLITVTAVVYMMIYGLILKNASFRTVAVDGAMQIYLTIAILLSAIVLSAIGDSAATEQNSTIMKIILQLYSIICTSMGLFLEFSLLYQKNTEYERDVLSQLMKENASQYEIERSAIRAINIKAHDLKHHITRMEKKSNFHEDEFFQDIKRAVTEYDVIYHTDNVALDTVLTMKGLTCDNMGITFTFFGEGSLLSFISDSDLYSLMGNILDNAIEAVEKLTDEDYKVISLTVENSNGLIGIHCENYYNDQQNIVYIDGRPITNKEDTINHGFGTHSIMLITEKYKGSCRFSGENGIFTTDIVFPCQ